MERTEASDSTVNASSNDNASETKQLMAGLRNRNAATSCSTDIGSASQHSRSKHDRRLTNMLLKCWVVVVLAAVGGILLFYFGGTTQASLATTSSSLRSTLVQKERISVPDASSTGTKSNLFPSWLENVMKQAASTESQRISFQLFDLSQSTDIPNPPPPFFYPVEDTLHSASFVMDNERHVVTSWVHDLRQAAQKRVTNTTTATTPRCLDIGSNGGFFALMSRAAGCRTLAVDAQPWCLTRLSSAAAMNNFDTNFDIQWTAVGQDERATIAVGATKCGGLWAVKNSDWIDDLSDYKVSVSMTPLLTLLEPWLTDGDRIDVMKIDVEGSEFAVLQSALPLFRENRIGSVYVEIAPQRTVEISSMADIDTTIREIYKAGYAFRDTKFSSLQGHHWKSQEEMIEMMHNRQTNVIVDYSIRRQDEITQEDVMKRPTSGDARRIHFSND